jgi:2',3'-cyclic-nucleotide 2'-phosphodiesterase
MKILFIGDIMGRPGREAVRHFVPRLKSEEGVEFVVANAENAAGGRGLTPSVAQELFQAGVNAVTMGNHTWDRPEIEPLLAEDRVLRPANYPPMLSGRGHAVYHVRDVALGVLQLMGRHHMANIDCPFRKADEILKDLKADVILVDMHAEATSEKQAMGWHLDGRVAAVVGSHTHVQTADERILPGGTAYLGDTGMTGPRDGIIGGKRDASLRRFLTGVPVRIEVAEGDAQFCACLLDLDEKTGKARSIRRVFETLKAEAAAAHGGREL